MTDEGPIVVITGVPGSGKSAVGRAVAARARFGLPIPIDDLREWVVGGRADPVPTWTAETGRQFALARRAAAETARVYASAGFAVAIDDMLSPDDAERAFARPLADLTVHKILLASRLDVGLARNRTRQGKALSPSLLEETIRRLHSLLDPAAFRAAGWTVLDTSDEPAAATIARVAELVGGIEQVGT